jgi:hypothetical protein
MSTLRPRSTAARARPHQLTRSNSTGRRTTFLLNNTTATRFAIPWAKWVIGSLHDSSLSNARISSTTIGHPSSSQLLVRSSAAINAKMVRPVVAPVPFVSVFQPASPGAHTSIRALAYSASPNRTKAPCCLVSRNAEYQPEGCRQMTSLK